MCPLLLQLPDDCTRIQGQNTRHCMRYTPAEARDPQTDRKQSRHADTGTTLRREGDDQGDRRENLAFAYAVASIDSL